MKIVKFGDVFVRLDRIEGYYPIEDGRTKIHVIDSETAYTVNMTLHEVHNKILKATCTIY